MKPQARKPAPRAAIASTCINILEVQEEDKHWVYPPEQSTDLHTEVDYLFLAGQLIKSGAVDASGCPAGGMGAKEGFANACGLEKARPKVLEIQNEFDGAIFSAWNKTGVPAVLLKQMIRYESQFYPGKFGVHVGLGHLTYLGADTALTWNQTLYSEVCTAYGDICDPLYRSMLTTTLLGLMDAECPTCSAKLDLPKAHKSVYFLAQSLLGYCNQTSQIIYNATKMHSSYVVDYATIWKLTLLNYNSGPNCVFNAVKGAYEDTDGQITWAHIKNHVTTYYCKRGATYVDEITEKVYDFPTE